MNEKKTESEIMIQFKYGLNFITFLKKIYFYFSCMGVLFVCMTAHMSMPEAWGSQKTSGPLEREIKMVVIFHVSAGKQTHVLQRSSHCS